MPGYFAKKKGQPVDLSPLARAEKKQKLYLHILKIHLSYNVMQDK